MTTFTLNECLEINAHYVLCVTNQNGKGKCADVKVTEASPTPAVHDSQPKDTEMSWKKTISSFGGTFLLMITFTTCYSMIHYAHHKYV